VLKDGLSTTSTVLGLLKVPQLILKNLIKCINLTVITKLRIFKKKITQLVTLATFVPTSLLRLAFEVHKSVYSSKRLLIIYSFYQMLFG